MVTTSKRFEFPKAKQAEQPFLTVFDKLERNDYMLIMLFATAYYNRVARKSAIAIHEQLQLSNTINSQCVRYLLLVYFIQSERKGYEQTPTHILERADLYKRDRTRLTSMLRLNEVGLCIFRKVNDKKNTLELTDLGRKAISIIIEQLNELIHTQPKRNEGIAASRKTISFSHV